MCAPRKYIGRRGNRTWYPLALSHPRYQRAILAYIYPCRDHWWPLRGPAETLPMLWRYTLHFAAPGRVPSGIPTDTGRAPVTFSENDDKSPLIGGRAPAGTRQDSGKASVMPWSQFTKGAVHFYTPQRPRVTFNLNLKVTRAPATNKPRIKPVKYRWQILQQISIGLK